jgi:hypothetical protein
VNFGRSPERILAAHTSDEIASFRRNQRTSGTSTATFPGPIPLESLAVPGDDGFWLDDEQGRTPARPQSREPHPQATIGASENEALRFLGPLHHCQLMTERDDLGLHYSLASKAAEERSEHH